MAEGCSIAAQPCKNYSRLKLNRSKSLSDLTSISDHLTHKNFSRSKCVTGKQFETKLDQASSSCTPKPRNNVESSGLKGNVEAPILLNGKKIESLSKEKLKEELSKRCLSKSGNKDVLIDRLRESLRNSRHNPSPPVKPDHQTQPVCVDLDGTLSDTGCPAENNESEVSSKHILNIIQELKLEIDGIKRRIPPSNYENVNNDLLNKLQRDNDHLRNSLESLSSRLQKVTEERDSLILTVKMLSRDLYNNSNQVCPPSNSSSLSNSQSEVPVANPSGNNNKGRSQTNLEAPVVSFPSTEASRFGQIQPRKNRNKSKKQPAKDAPINLNQTSSPPVPATSVIIGDSMVKNVHGWSLGKDVGRRVVVKSFSGATTSDMSHYLKPTLTKKPDQIVLHVGTNDIGKLLPHQIADSIVDLAREIENSSDAQVMVSELITRSDESSSADVAEVNKRLLKFCNQNHWPIIRHNNIHQSHLNKRGLHLNERGNEILRDNFVRTLRNCAQ